MTDKKKALNDIVRYGLFAFAEKIKPDINEVIRQLMFCYYRDRKQLTPYLLEMLEYNINDGYLCLDVDYNGFHNTEFNPETETEQLREIFIEDCEFEAKAIEFYKIRQSCTYMGFEGNFNNCLSVGRQIHENIQKGEPMPMIERSLLVKFIDEDKTEFELMQFALNIGIRSIIGEKVYSKTNKQMILCRAFGYISNKHLPETMPEVYWKYNIRYQYEKIKQEIEFGNWNLIFYSDRTRGVYIGFKSKITYDKLADIALMKKTKTKVENLKMIKKTAHEKALIKILQQRTQQQ